MGLAVRGSHRRRRKISQLLRNTSRETPSFMPAPSLRRYWPRHALFQSNPSGRVAPEIGNDRIRERFVYSYRLVYEIEERAVNTSLRSPTESG
uniref:ParE toxin of type II toxin-antitoxin system, parDE n=1 Tax=Candidatus Kentrum sp. DK TaxID=2126562 RepID=A0A450RZZ6_9GAMM|nr:MAG: hypothetical protein BECKDK2373B_GA0170837_100866 [Candidatus Kentron sp. DK]